MTMKQCMLACALLIALSHSADDAAGQRVLVFSVDGLRADAMEVASTPNIDALIANGTYSHNSTTSDLTFSGPGQTELLSGVHRDLHGAATNSTADHPTESDPQFRIYAGSNMHNYPDFLAIANVANPTLQTARFTGGWTPAHQTRSPAGSEYTFVGSDAAATSDAASYYANPANNAEVGFVYLAEPDYAGHDHGFNPNITAYTDRISQTDAEIGNVISAIKGRPNFAAEDWVFLLGADHGGNRGGGHSGNQVWQREVPFIASGDSIINQTLPYGAKNVDIVPTALTHLGVPLPSYLAGHVVGITAPVLPNIELDSNLLFNGDAEFDHGFSSTSFDQVVTGWNEFPDADLIAETANYGGNDSITVIKYGSSGFPAAGGGENLFAAGGNADATMTQTIDLSTLAATIDAGINFQLDAHLGGDSGSDRADLSVEWFDDSESSLGSALINGTVAAGGLLLNRRGAVVPTGARSAVVSLTMFGTDIYADDISLQLTANDVINTSTLIGDFDDDGDIDGDDWSIFAAELGSTMPTVTDLTGDGVNNHSDFRRFKEIFEDFNGAGSFATLLGQVPEPSTALLALLSAAGLVVGPAAGRCRRLEVR